MRSIRGMRVALSAIVLWASAALAQEGPKLTIGGTTYTKWLWGNNYYDGSMYNFTTVPGEGFGDTGQGSELELLLNAKLSRQVEVSARLHSRFNQNEWTNFGGFGDPAGKPGGDPACVGGACGEFDPRSNQYVKLRGVRVVLTPGYEWIDSATIGANDFGQFDPFVIGRIRYIDRDNAAGLLFQGSALNRRLTWDAVRISLPRLWAGPNFSTGSWTGGDASYGFQFKLAPSGSYDLAGIFDWNNDEEIDGTDNYVDQGRHLKPRFRNAVVGGRLGARGGPVDFKANAYWSTANSSPLYGPTDFFGLSGFSPVPVGSHKDWSGKADVTITDPLGVGLSFNLEVFNIGADYVSLMASRREADVLLTEGHDAAFAFPGPSNAAFGVFKGNPTRIGYGGWSGNAQQVPTINVDNEFTDFDEPLAESVIGWRGFTINPVFGAGRFDLSGEYTLITYSTNWQAFGNDSRPVTSTVYPVQELDTGVGHNFRSAYAPFQDKLTHLLALRLKYVLDYKKGIDLFANAKYIKETDNRLNDPRYLPYAAGDCPGGGVGCAGTRNNYFGANSTADVYGNPGLVTAGGVTGYQWKPFNSVSDDDRNLNYLSLTGGAGYQFTDDLYLSLAYAWYYADLKDGNTAFQAYNLHEMASGKHTKNQVILKARYILAGVEFGMEAQYNFGWFKPDFGKVCRSTSDTDCFVAQIADATLAADHNVAVGSRGFSGRFGGWNSLETRHFEQVRLKAFMKAQF